MQALADEDFRPGLTDSALTGGGCVSSVYSVVRARSDVNRWRVMAGHDALFGVALAAITVCSAGPNCHVVRGRVPQPPK